ncbi:hypothetical protein BKG71_15800 [Mycobacteroides chelonae]|nr:hypothetical protein BKG66_23365 [Mycobacteroides chelonae]OHU04560.1 hypothetical protein BKG71_15800 [Mycobacteroides chelonae]OHU52800.1 hypothetical protein BKG81_02585 [Mycobacteroides chelonae]
MFSSTAAHRIGACVQPSFMLKVAGCGPFLRIVHNPTSTKKTGVIRATQTGIPMYVGLLRKLTMQTVADRAGKSCRALP